MWAVAVALLKNKKNEIKTVVTQSAAKSCVHGGADSVGPGGGHVLPHFYKWLGTGGTVSRRTANKKLTKLY